VEIYSIGELYKARVKPFVRTRKGKMERVKGFERNIARARERFSAHVSKVDEISTMIDRTFRQLSGFRLSPNDQARKNVISAAKVGTWHLGDALSSVKGVLWGEKYNEIQKDIRNVRTQIAKVEKRGLITLKDISEASEALKGVRDKLKLTVEGNFYSVAHPDTKALKEEHSITPERKKWLVDRLKGVESKLDGLSKIPIIKGKK
jgi:hypothetical protein